LPVNLGVGEEGRPVLAGGSTTEGGHATPAAPDTIDANIGVEVFKNTMVERTSCMSFFTTEDGLMGVGAEDARPGDVVCVLLGAQVPLLLRPQGEHFAYVGECYMCGIMFGQVIEEAEKGLRQYETFDLR
jgi:hypothetical protein